MEQINRMYLHVYGESGDLPEEMIYRQLEEALHTLMGIGDELTAQSQEIAIASVAAAIRKYQVGKDWPSLSYMQFAETWGSIPKFARETILTLTIPHLTSSQRHPALLWFIDEAIEMKMNALLHISFMECASESDDWYIRAMAAYTLVQLPVSYWEETGQLERRAKLIARAKLDPSSKVRAELGV